MTHGTALFFLIASFLVSCTNDYGTYRFPRDKALPADGAAPSDAGTDALSARR